MSLERPENCSECGAKIYWSSPNNGSCVNVLCKLPIVVFTPGEVTVDEVNHPAHYTQGDIECIDAIRAALTAEEFRGYLKGNIIKYIWRERMKKGVSKAQWYINKFIEVFGG